MENNHVKLSLEQIKALKEANDIIFQVLMKLDRQSQMNETEEFIAPQYLIHPQDIAIILLRKDHKKPNHPENPGSSK